MPKTEKRLTKKQRKELHGKGPSGTPKTSGSGHIHCLACGRHIDPDEFTRAVHSATWLTCQHGSRFASCTSCTVETQTRLDEHDRTGQPPRVTPAWH